MGEMTADSKPRRRFRIFRLFLIAFVLILFAGSLFAYRWFWNASRFSRQMPEAEARRITDKSIAENDVATFVAIHEDYWHARKNPGFFERLRDYYRIYSVGGSKALSEHRSVSFEKSRLIPVNLWYRQLSDPNLRNHPRLMEAVIRQLEIARQANKMKSPDSESRQDPVTMAIEENSMRLYDEQLRTGEALDHLWKVFVVSGNADALCDWVSKSMEANIDFRGLETILIGFMTGDPENPFVRRAMGLLFWSQGRFAEAEPLLRSAAMMLDDDPHGRFAWAECRQELKLPFEPENIMGLISPENANFRTQEARRLVLLARLFETAGDMRRVADSLEAAVRINPWDREAWFRLIPSRVANGDQAGSQKAKDRADSLESVETAIRKAHESYRRGDRRPEAVLQAIVEADDSRFDAIIAAWRAFRKEADSKMPDSAPVPDLFFTSRPVLRNSSAGPFRLDSPSTESAGGTVSEITNSIELEIVPATRSGIEFGYRSFAGKNLRVADVMGGGVAVFDYDGDGRVDIYFPQGCSFDAIDKPDSVGQSRLYRNRGDWNFEDVTDRAGLGGRGYAMGATVGDFDADGKPDMFVTGYGNATLYRNRGDGSFEDVTGQAGVSCNLWTTAAAFADFDGDGDEDLFAVTYVNAPLDQPESCPDDSGRLIHCSPGRFEAQPDKLWENLGNGKFRDVSESSGIAATSKGRGLGMAVIDLDDDGRLDVFVANDASPNFFFRNEGKLQFREMADEAGLAVDGSGRATASMGVVADDLDADGRVDIFHTNFLNEPNTFRKNLGGGLFQDTTMAMGLSASGLSKTGFGAIAADADHDGSLDLFVANGHLDDQPWIGVAMAQKPLFYRGNGARGFTLLPESAFPYLSKPVVGRGMAAGDFDDDGLVDLVIVHRDEPVSVLRNVSKKTGRWIGFDIRTAKGGPPPAGTRIELVSGGRKQVRHIAGGTGYLSHSDSRVVFGLGASEKVEGISLRWPDRGQIRSLILDPQGLSIGRYRKIELK